MSVASNNTLLGLDRTDLLALVEKTGEPAYRAQQLADAIYGKRVKSIDEISTLPSQMRQNLIAEGFSIGVPKIDKRFLSKDGTVRYLMEFSDGQSVETVWMPEGDGGESGDGSETGDISEIEDRPWDRATICVSSQVGCAVDCQFCPYRSVGGEAKPDRGRDCRTGLCRSERSVCFATAGSHQSCLYGYGRAIS